MSSIKLKTKHKRCDWASGNPLYENYHDAEWGRPVHCDRTLFEFLILEGAQAGLSWLTVLKKRDNYRKAYDSFDPQKVAKYTQKKRDELMLNDGIIRNRLKIASSIKNAKLFMDIQREFGSFDQYIWNYVYGRPIVNKFKNIRELPAKTPLSDKISQDLKKRGFAFVGSTIIYAFMQAVGMVNDHLVTCPVYKQCGAPK